MFRRILGDPLEFHYNDTTFTTAVSLENRKDVVYATLSGSTTAINLVKGAYKETKGREGKLYKIVIKKEIDRILDLDKVCEEQGIEREYLKIYPTNTGRNSKKEKELFNLYGKEIREKRIHGVKYRSRRYSVATCFLFYDTLIDLHAYLDAKEEPESLS